MMSEIDGSLDLRMMRTLALLLNECSVSRTADILGQSQPTVSAALKRLRGIFKDPLLVRDGNALLRTERGEELRDSVTRILLDIEANFSAAQSFDPNTDRCFQILAALCLSALLLPRVVRKVMAEAPNASLHFSQHVTDDDILKALREGELDVVLTSGSYQPGELRMAPLMSCDMVCLVREDHPLAARGAIDLNDYYEQAHLTLTPRPMMSFGPIDGQLNGNRPRRIAVTASEFGVVPLILAESELVFTTGRPLAEYLASTAPLTIIEAPLELEPMRFQMLWHDRQHRAPVHQWLRGIIRAAAQDMQRAETFRTRRLMPLAPQGGRRDIAAPAC